MEHIGNRSIHVIFRVQKGIGIWVSSVLLLISLLLAGCAPESVGPQAEIPGTNAPEIETTVPIETISDNPLIAAELCTDFVLNGSKTDVIGQRAYIKLSKSGLKEITLDEYREFCEAVVDNSIYNWISIICDDGTGIQFAGSQYFFASYGAIDYEGCITQEEGVIHYTGEEFIFEPNTPTVTIGNLKFTLPDGMSVLDSGDDSATVSLTSDNSTAAVCIFTYDVSDCDSTTIDVLLTARNNAFKNSFDTIGESDQELSFAGFTAKGQAYALWGQDEIVGAGMTVSLSDTWYIYTFSYFCKPEEVNNDTAKQYGYLFGTFLGSCEYVGDPIRTLD